MKKCLSMLLCILVLAGAMLTSCNKEDSGEADNGVSYDEALSAGDYEAAYEILLSGDKEASKEELGKFIVLPISVSCDDVDGKYPATFSYDEKGLLTKLDIAKERDGKAYSFTYDEKGNLLTEKYGDSDGSYTNHTTTNTYDEKGQVTVSETTYASGRKVTCEYTYDENGRVQTEIETTVESWGDTNTIVYNSIYDAKGNLLSRKSAKGNGHEYTYDDQNRLVTENDVHVEDGPYNLRTYTYGDDGRLVKEKWESVTSSDWWTETTYAYDANGTQYITLYSDSGDTEAYTYAYEFDDNGNLTKKIYTERDDNEQRVSLFDVAGNIVSIDITKGETTAKYTFNFDKFGNKTGESFSQNGVTKYSYALTFEVKYFENGAPELSEFIREIYELSSISYFF